MARWHDRSDQPDKRPVKHKRSFRDILAAKRPQISYRQRVSNKMTILGMTIGYLGLVAILASAPLWNHRLVSDQAPPLSCTEFGSSR